MTCTVCNGSIEPGRMRIGLCTCLACGDRLARRDIALKNTQVMQPYNKGGYVYAGGASFKQNALDAGRKTSAELIDTVTQASPRARYHVRRRYRNRVGIAWDQAGDCFAVFDVNDPRLQTAVRYVIW